MFVSQVIFETNKENEEVLRGMVQRRTENTKDVPGLLSSECWRKEDKETVGYCFVNKWNRREDFLTWMREIHSGQERHAQQGKRDSITKTVYQFEVIS